MKYETITLCKERNVSLTVMIQGVGGEFRGISDRPAVLVIPGGGYMFCSDREADPVAAAYLRAGYHAFILRYSVGADAVWPRPLQDYEEAMALIDAHAEEWHVLRDKIAVVGFSAGGHLAGAAATLAKRRPAAAVLGYAVLREDTAHELGEDKPSIVEAVDENTCPCFLFATRTDSVVPIQNTLDMMNALNRFQTSFECHIYPYGPHGFSHDRAGAPRPCERRRHGLAEPGLQHCPHLRQSRGPAGAGPHHRGNAQEDHALQPGDDV